MSSSRRTGRDVSIATPTSRCFGVVSRLSSVRTDKFSGEPRGFAFVEIPAKIDAQSAVNDLTGKELKGRERDVNEARPRPEALRGGRRPRRRPTSLRAGGGGHGGGRRSALARADDAGGNPK